MARPLVRPRSGTLAAVCCVGALLFSACAGRALRLPTDPGTALPDPARIHRDLTASCSGVRTLTAELALAGRAGDQRLRGRALAGFQAPDAMRLEGLAPFGPPGFILAARDGQALLILPRDDRVLRNAEPDDILGALTGVALGPSDLQAILTGCVTASAKAVGGWQHAGGWVSIALSDGTRLYASGARDVWRLRAARREGWQIEYPEWQGRFPRTVRLMASGNPRVDMTAQIAQLETNVPIDPAAFTIEVPRDALPISLDELREAGPLRGNSTSPREPDDPDVLSAGRDFLR